MFLPLAAIAFIALISSSCILSPDIEPREEPDLAPRIEPLPPYEKMPVIEVTRETFFDTVYLSADLFDGNPHEELSYLFLSDERGDPRLARAQLNGKRGDEYYFGVVGFSVNPCTGEVAIPGTEVISLFVADRGFTSTSPIPEEIVANDGAIMVAYSWTLKYEAGICDP
jgi:hypothetical protein